MLHIFPSPWWGGIGRGEKEEKMKKFKLILAIVVFGLLVLGFIKDQVIKSVVSAGVKKVAGTPVRIDGLSIGIFRQSVRITGLRLYNPSEFPKEVLIDLPEISLDYSLPDILKGKLTLPFLAIHLKELTVIKNQSGRLNIDGLQLKQGDPLPMQIDSLALNIGRVVWKDYSQGPEPKVETFEADIKNKIFKNITSAQQLAIMLIVEAIKPTAIKTAGIYGATAFLGDKYIPPVIKSLLTSKNYAEEEFTVGYDRVYKVCLETIQSQGQVSKENKPTGEIKATVNGNDVNITVSKTFDSKVQVMVKASKFFIPQTAAASGILFKISEKLK